MVLFASTTNRPDRLPASVDISDLDVDRWGPPFPAPHCYLWASWHVRSNRRNCLRLNYGYTDDNRFKEVQKVIGEMARAFCLEGI
jgi:hypothetical protein